MDRKLGSTIINAYNIHQGGGRRLLHALMKSFDKISLKRINVDPRLDIPSEITLDPQTVKKIAPTFLGRFFCEWRLKGLTTKADTLICLGNLPPLFKNRAKTIVFMQNRYVIDDMGFWDLSPLVRFKVFLEKVWFWWGRHHADKYIVQTQQMKELLERHLVQDIPVEVSPLYDGPIAPPKEMSESPSFVYVASSNPNKNHSKLFEAWELLLAEGLTPTLKLTLEKSDGLLLQKVEELKSKGASIENHPGLSFDEVVELYKSSDILIYPSYMESYGLPLKEAAGLGLKVVASELDYVRDVVDPIETFDPFSARSIARAVKRVLGITEVRPKAQRPQQWMEQIL